MPADSDIQSLDDLTGEDVKIAIGSEDVPIGSYTRETLAKLPAEQEQAILANVRSNEPDVKGIVGKLTLGRGRRRLRLRDRRERHRRRARGDRAARRSSSRP